MGIAMVTWLPLNSGRADFGLFGGERTPEMQPPPPIHIWEAAGLKAGGHCGPEEGGSVSAEPSH